ncbi:sugar ABC transporter permease [Streptomyces sp. V4-01]|uniref:Sugar ABC transporter permease n=1 Tax=Actinacidiphila polyblastidii TaxID=3110430 RepID=A0ABU7PGJ5_9ACTN|nr:sugar ABC transporter permease [Streptomyces sp. V4-01]
MSTSPGVTRRRPSPMQRSQNRAGLAFVSPTLLVVLVIVVVPIAWTVLLAFQHARLIDLQGMGLFGNWTWGNFDQVFTAPGFWTSLWTTLVYTVGGTVGSILLGLVAALALRRPFRGRGVVRSTMLLPYVAPVVAVTFVWETALNPQTGVINNWGMHLFGWHRPIAFLSTSSYKADLLGVHVHLPMALMTVVAFEIWRYFPFAFLFLLARLQAVPAGIEEAATVDGATQSQRFRYILLPQLMPVIALLSVLRFIMTFNKFDDIYLLTGGNSGTEVVSVRVYNFLTASYDVGAAAAQALLLAAILMVLLGIYFGFFAKRVQEEEA